MNFYETAFCRKWDEREHYPISANLEMEEKARMLIVAFRSAASQEMPMNCLVVTLKTVNR
jgi:hypothetical protein